MAHFAEIDTNNIVLRVIVADQEFIDSGAIGDPSSWIQTSYNTKGGVHYDPDTRLPDNGVALRKNYAGPGYIYHPVGDFFSPPKPYDSWVINEDTGFWEAPLPLPDDTNKYDWDEDNQQWVLRVVTLDETNSYWDDAIQARIPNGFVWDVEQGTLLPAS